MTLTIELSHAKVAAMIKSRHKATRDAIVRGVHRGAFRGMNVMMKRTPTDQSQLKQSWRVTKAFPSSASVMQLAALINDAAHAGIVEGGARPHKVSAEGWAAIYQWVYRHRRYFGFVTKSGRTARARATIGDVRTKTDVVPELASVTWGIVKRLEREGQKPTWFVRESLPVLTEVLEAEVETQIAKVAARRVAGDGK